MLQLHGPATLEGVHVTVGGQTQGIPEANLGMARFLFCLLCLFSIVFFDCVFRGVLNGFGDFYCFMLFVFFADCCLVDLASLASCVFISFLLLGFLSLVCIPFALLWLVFFISQVATVVSLVPSFLVFLGRLFGMLWIGLGFICSWFMFVGLLGVCWQTQWPTNCINNKEIKSDLNWYSPLWCPSRIDQYKVRFKHSRIMFCLDVLRMYAVFIVLQANSQSKETNPNQTSQTPSNLNQTNPNVKSLLLPRCWCLHTQLTLKRPQWGVGVVGPVTPGGTRQAILEKHASAESLGVTFAFWDTHVVVLGASQAYPNSVGQTVSRHNSAFIIQVSNRVSRSLQLAKSPIIHGPFLKSKTNSICTVSKQLVSELIMEKNNFQLQHLRYLPNILSTPQDSTTPLLPLPHSQQKWNISSLPPKKNNNKHQKTGENDVPSCRWWPSWPSVHWPTPRRASSCAPGCIRPVGGLVLQLANRWDFYGFSYWFLGA